MGSKYVSEISKFAVYGYFPLYDRGIKSLRFTYSLSIMPDESIQSYVPFVPELKALSEGLKSYFN